MGLFQWGVRQSAEVENQMTSVERIFEYSRLTPEAPLESEPDKKPDSDWPKNGAITGSDVSLKYSEDTPVVLKNLSFNIRCQEKVGVVYSGACWLAAIVGANDLVHGHEVKSLQLIEEQVLVDGTYVCLIFKWVAVTWLKERAPGW